MSACVSWAEDEKRRDEKNNRQIEKKIDILRHLIAFLPLLE